LIDIILGVDHKSEHGKKFLLEQRDYMPKQHRDFLTYVENHFKTHSLKTFAMANLEVFLEYNCAVKELRTFRQAHYKLVHDYIVKFIKTPEEIEKGSGGLMFKELSQYIKDTSNTTIVNVPMKTTESNLWLWLCGTICVAYVLSQVLQH
jgi:indoleamine 2,3-dioxygenase